MLPEEQDVQAEPSSAITAAIASSPEVEQEAQQSQEAQTPTAEQGATQEQEPQEEPRVPYSRLKEVIDEKNWLRSQLERQQPTQPVPQQPTTDPFAGMTPEEERFWRMQRQIAKEEAEKVTQERMGQIQPVIDAGRMELAQMKVQQFRVAHPDIKADSQEEVAIAQRISSGYHPEDAYWAVMGPRGIRVAQQQVKQQVKQQMTAKKSANGESSAGVSSQAQQNAQPSKKSFREDFMKNMRLAEEGKL